MTTNTRKFTPEVGELIVSALRDGKSLATAAEAAGTHRTTLHRWIKAGGRGDASEALRAFASAVEQAQSEKVRAPYEYDLTSAAHIIILIEEGWELRKAVAIVNGPSLSTVRNWIRRGRVERAPPDFAAFSERYDRAIAERNLQRILEHIDRVEERWGRDGD